MLIIIFIYWNDWELGAKSCVSHLSVFIIIFAYVQFFHVLRKTVLIYVWKRQDDPGILQSKIDFWFIIAVVIPELALYIYGNVILFKPSQEFCRNDSILQSLWRCCLTILIYGYLYMLCALGFILFFCGVFFLYRAWSTDTTN